MRPRNTRDRKIQDDGLELRGAYTKYSTERQRHLIKKLMMQHDVSDLVLWLEHFDEEYPESDPNWKETISSGAASELIQWLLNYQTYRAFTAKIQRTEQEQHEWEMYPDGKL